jgi:hypothetical protein
VRDKFIRKTITFVQRKTEFSVQVPDRSRFERISSRNAWFRSFEKNRASPNFSISLEPGNSRHGSLPRARAIPTTAARDYILQTRSTSPEPGRHCRPNPWRAPVPRRRQHYCGAEFGRTGFRWTCRKGPITRDSAGKLLPQSLYGINSHALNPRRD